MKTPLEIVRQALIDLHETGALYKVEIEIEEQVPCKTHPDAPHGFNRNASHSLDRYVCTCEHWEPEE